MRSGDRPGLQNRRVASCDVAGGFDPHSLPPLFSDKNGFPNARNWRPELSRLVHRRTRDVLGRPAGLRRAPVVRSHVLMTYSRSDDKIPRLHLLAGSISSPQTMYGHFPGMVSPRRGFIFWVLVSLATFWGCGGGGGGVASGGGTGTASAP